MGSDPTDTPVLSPQEACEQIEAAFDTIDAALTILRTTPTDSVGTAFRVQMAARLETAERANRALMYQVFAEIDAPPDEEPCAAARSDLWQRLHIPPREIVRRMRVGARLHPRRTLLGPTLDPELPAVATALADGAIGEDHLRVICRTLDTLPRSVAPDDVAHAEQTLAHHARTVDSALLARLGERVADALNPDGTFTDEDRARRRFVRLGSQGPDGMSKLTGLLDPETRAYLDAITAAVRPGRHHPDNPTGLLGGDQRSNGQRCHDAVKLALKTAIASGKLGTHRGHPVTVIVTATVGELTAAAQAADDPTVGMPADARTGSGARLPMRDLIRLASEALHYLAVFDDHTQRPLYLGRQQRVATADQRLICYARDRGCTRPNCTTGGYDCEVHHTPDWAVGGRTNADQLHFACGPDHASTTTGENRTTVTASGRLGWTNGSSPPTVNHAHHPDELLRGDPDPPSRR